MSTHLLSKLTLKKVSVIKSFLILHSFSAHLALIFPDYIYAFFNHDFASVTKAIGTSHIVENCAEHFWEKLTTSHNFKENCNFRGNLGVKKHQMTADFFAHALKKSEQSLLISHF